VVPDQMSKECARYEPVAWWFTRSRIGRGLREQYEIPTELSSNLLAVIRQLDAIEENQLFREFQRGHHGETADSAISTPRACIRFGAIHRRVRRPSAPPRSRAMILVKTGTVALAFSNKREMSLRERTR
jgi:hypothetical protein